MANLPAEAEGVRIAVIADLHIDCWRGKRWCETFVARLNALQPDIVVFTGDQVDGEIECRREDLSPLAAIQAPGGKFLISGNHEFMFDAEGYLGLYEALGLTVLDGRIATSRGITFVGLPDERSLVVSHNVPILDRLVKELPPEAFSVLLVHKPGIAPEADATIHEVKPVPAWTSDGWIAKPLSAILTTISSKRPRIIIFSPLLS